MNPIYKYLRYSSWFIKLQKLFIHTAREKFLHEAMEFISSSKIEGDYLEFGVFQGKTFVSAYHFAQRSSLKKMRFYGFDSFEGLPDIIGNDKEGEFQKGQYSYSLDDFKRVASCRGVSLNRVKLVQGWYDKVLNSETKMKLPIKKAAIVMVDCDLYESTVPVLDFITDYIQAGTILAFDDWFCFKGNPEKGEQKAFKEWLKKNSSIKAIEYHKFGWHGNSFIIYKGENERNDEI